jgi:uncharacterized protein
MDITPVIPKTRQVVTGYGDGGFKVNDEFVEGSLLVFPDQAMEWGISDAASITAASLDPVLRAEPSIELLLIGTGKTIVPLEPPVRQLLRSRNIAVEVMDTGAACRTYNVLMSEERRVAAALIAI